MNKRRLAAISFLLFSFTLSILVAGGIQTARSQENLTLEGTWEIISGNIPALRSSTGRQLSISRKNTGYECKWSDTQTATLYSGNAIRLTNTSLQDLVDEPGPGVVFDRIDKPMPPSVRKEVSGIKVPVNTVITLTGDGNFLQWVRDAKWVYWKNGRFTRYEIKPGYNVMTAKRVSGPPKVEDRSDRAYQANCGQLDPNRTTPFTPDHEFCPGNLVCMTNFCGSGTGCPYVCCPKGLPYLNHCDCTCYTTSDFECHSYSYCREKLIR